MVVRAMILQEIACVDWDAFERSLHERFGVNAVTLDKNGNRRTAGDIPWANDLCTQIKMHRKGAERICDTLKQYLMVEADAKARVVTDECAAGMYRMMVPIIRGKSLIGFVIVCGRPFLTADLIYTDDIHRTIGTDAETIREILPSLDPIGPRTLNEMKRFISDYAH